MNLRILLSFLALAVSSIAYALPTSHSPFSREEQYTLTLDTCSTSREVTNIHPPEGTVEFRSDAGSTLTLTMSGMSYSVQVHTGSTPRSMKVDLDVEATTPNDVLEDAVCADLNLDGEVDFAVTLWLHGNGLGAAFYKRLIAISSPDGYAFWIVPTMWPSKDDFVSFGSLEPIVLLTTDWVNSGGVTDPPHAYLVYDLWTFREGTIISANSVDSRFSKWVWWTFGTNHKPARSLTDEMKQRIRRSPQIPIEVKP